MSRPAPTHRPHDAPKTPTARSDLRPGRAARGRADPGLRRRLAIPAVLASLFVPTDFGTYTQLFLIAGTLYCVGQLGMAESLLYFVPLGLACAAMECLPSLHRSLSANRPRATVPSERARRHGV